jgi:hypothetical protein
VSKDTIGAKKIPRKDSLSGLVIFFSELLPTDSWGKLNSPVNAPAMIAGLRKVRDAGNTPETIRAMMRLFVSGLASKPLPDGVAPWRAFLANLDALASAVTATNLKEPDTYDDLQPDKRLI